MNSETVDVLNLANHSGDRIANMMRSELQKVINANMGFERFVAAYDSWMRRIEVVFVRDGQMSWYRIPPTEAGVKQFLLALPVLVTLEPTLAEWPKYNRV